MDLEEEVLDFEPKEGKVFRYNRLYSVVRFFLSALLIGNILRSIYVNFQRAYVGYDALVYYLGVLLPIIIYAWFIYYNIVQGKMEKAEGKIYPKFKKPTLILFIFVTLTITVLSLSNIFQGSLIAIMIASCCAIILTREFRYFQLLSAYSKR